MAKKFLLLFCLLGTSVLLSSCGGGEEKKEIETVIDEDYDQFQMFDLSKYDIPAYIYLPDETANIGASTKPEVKHIESEFLWEINVGPNFQLTIEDWGETNDMIKEEKKNLAEMDFFKIKYLVDEKDIIVYERTLVARGDQKAPSSVGVKHKTYHVYAIKNIDGINYEFQSREEGYEQLIIELMAKSIQSIKPKTDKA